MLTLYRRHLKTCASRDKGRRWKRCKCPVWLDGSIDGRDIRRSLKTTAWDRAEEEKAKVERNPFGRQEGPISIRDAADRFLADAAVTVSQDTLKKYRRLLHTPPATKTHPDPPIGLVDFFASKGKLYAKQITTEELREFRQTWRDAPLSASKKLERMKSMFARWVTGGHIEENPATALKPPKVKPNPTLPFTQQEMVEIYAACEKYPDNYGRTGRPDAVRLRTFVLTLRFTGMRIRDAIQLSRDQVERGAVLIYTQKTGTGVWCPIPEALEVALEACPTTSPKYYFWTGAGNPKSAVGNWQRSLRKLFRLAGVENGHAHRFRDTFAVELLQSGVPIEEVSILLGHSSIRITEKYYSPWVKSRQIKMEANVRKAWEQDPILDLRPGTPEGRKVN